MIVLLDTNALLMPHQHKVDLFAEIERVIPEKHEVATLSTVISELEGIAVNSTNDDGVAAKVGLKLVADKGVRVIESSGNVDDTIARYAMEQGTIACTNDKELKARVIDAGATVVFMRGKKKLVRIGKG
jgi:rRNA-processing protein FCF1